MPNRLASETSPYLLQHAHNPVDWFPWGDEAFAEAQASDRPILLSIGYSACHWCHVMERESFEDADTASVMNDLFVNVKVDREERPDVDQIYMQAVQALTGHGGWPLTVFLRPDGVPFYGGTYFPPEVRHGMPAFVHVLRSASRAYAEQRERVDETAQRLKLHIEEASKRGAGLGGTTGDAPAPQAVLAEAAARTMHAHDPTWGGFGGAPKFPQPSVLRFLLQGFARTGDDRALTVVRHTLDRMAAGGIRDHLGGGFHRYSVDERWLVPHFEKMLYDQALIASAYIEAYQATGNDAYRAVAEGTLDYVIGDLEAPTGGFFSARDADSEGEEGLFYVWTPDEVDSVLGPRSALFNRVYDVSAVGNFEGKNILHLPHELDALARAEGMEVEGFHDQLAADRKALLAARADRVEPLRDEKVLAGWTALAIRALATGGVALGRRSYIDAAVRAAEALLGPLSPNGRLRHSFKDGVARFDPVLFDVAAAGNAYLDLHAAQGEARWLLAAVEAARAVVDHYWDDELELLFDTAADAEALIVRPRDVHDGAVPSGQSLGAELLGRVSRITGDSALHETATRVLASIPDLARHPVAFGAALSVVEWMTAPPIDVVLVGDPRSEEGRAMGEVVARTLLPGVSVAWLNPAESGGDRETIEKLPIFQDRTQVDGNVTAYVCWHHSCSLPITDPESLSSELEDAASRTRESRS